MKAAPLHWCTPWRGKTGVIAPFVVKKTPEAGTAPLRTCLPWHMRPTSTSSEALPVVANHCATLRPRVTRTLRYVIGTGFCGFGRTGVTSLRAHPPSAQSSNSAGNTGNRRGASACRKSSRKRISGCSREVLRRSPMIEVNRRLVFGKKKSSKSVARQIAPQMSSRLSSSRQHQKPERLHCTRVTHGAATCSTDVVAPFVVKTIPEAGAAPLHSCLPMRCKLLRGSHRAIHR